MRPKLITVVIAAAVALSSTGCTPEPSAETPGTKAPASSARSERVEPLDSADFDECDLVEPEELATATGVKELFVTWRRIRVNPNGGLDIDCLYDEKDAPRMDGRVVGIRTNADARTLFEKDRSFGETEAVEGLGDRAVVGFRELRVLRGDIGLTMTGAFDLDKDEGERLFALARKAVQRLPEEPEIVRDVAEGRCGELDRSAASEALGAKLTAARSVGAGDRVGCSYAGEQAGLDIVVWTGQDAELERSVPARDDPFEISEASAYMWIAELSGERTKAVQVFFDDEWGAPDDHIIRVELRYHHETWKKRTAPNANELRLLRSVVDAFGPRS